MYTPLCHTHYSLLRAFSKPKQLVKQLANYNIGSCALTDFDSLSGSVHFYKECKSAGIKPILGGKFLYNGEYLTLLAKNLKGWKELLKICSKSFKSDQQYLDTLDILSTENVLVLGSLNTDKILSHELKDRFIYQSKNGEFGNGFTIAAPDIRYTYPEDKVDNDILLCSNYGVTVPELSDIDNVRNAHLKTYDELLGVFGEELLKNTLLLSDMVEEFSILNQPSLPHFDTLGTTNVEFLRELCREGWRKKIHGKIDQSKIDEYVSRVKYELSVIDEAHLSSYFLIVQDYINHVKDLGWFLSPGRGSSAGSLVAYLTNITTIDPIVYKLLFERFYNPGRNTKDNISLPDVDTDFPPEVRPIVFAYLTQKYGKAFVSQVATFAELKGAGALKEVLRAHSACNNYQMNAITKKLPQEGEISDKLEEQKETSIIRWALNNEPKSLEQWCRLKDGVYTGDFAKYFEQAIRIEGTLKSYGKHASALIICGTPLDEICPMIKEKNGDELVVGYDYDTSASAAGCVKMDILGLDCLSKSMNINRLLKYGKI
jgi:DNA polymerase-3 subunit alpha